MSLLGIVANHKAVKNLNKFFDNGLMYKKNNIFYINSKNISNMKNIQFETIVLDSIIDFEENMKKILKEAKYILINADLSWPKQYLEDLKAIIITYGYRSKATLTVSSNEQEETLLFLQRRIKLDDKTILEPQEIKVDMTDNTDIYTIMITTILFLINPKNNYIKSTQST